MTALALQAWAFPHIKLSRSRTSGFSDAVSEPAKVPPSRLGPQTTVSEPDWMLNFASRVAQLYPLGDNWDGRGSAAINMDAVIFAFSMLQQIMPPATKSPGMVPLSNGGIQLAWHSGSADLEVEVLRPNEIYAFFVNNLTGQEQEWEASADFSTIADILWREFNSRD